MKKALIIIIVLVLVAVFIIAASRLKKKPDTGNSVSGFEDEFFAWLWKKAGGLADGTIAGDADLERAHGTVTVNGRTYVNPHTNRDVTWRTFKNLAPQFGYKADFDTFVAMPYALWTKIVDHIIFKKGGNWSSNKVIAAYIGTWYWGTGSIGAAWQEKIQNILQRNLSSVDELRELIDLRISFFNSLSYSQSVKDGWIRRANSFWDNFKKFA